MNQPNASPDTVLNALCPMFVQFAAVAREGQVTKAAAVLGVPQPSITRHLARLESVLGVRLYARGRDGMALTAEGEKLVPSVQQALEVLTAAIVGLQAGTARPRVTLAFLHTLGEHAVPVVLRRFGEHSPQVKFSLVQDSADQLLRRLRDGQVELCLTSPLPTQPDIEVVRLGLQRLVLAVPAGHYLAQESDTALAAAASDDFVALKPGNYTRLMADELCRTAGFEPRVAVEAAGISTVRGLVAAGLGVAIVPAAPAAITGLAEIPLTDAGAYREVGLAWRAGVELAEPARQFRRFAIEQFANALNEDLADACIWRGFTTSGDEE